MRFISVRSFLRLRVNPHNAFELTWRWAPVRPADPPQTRSSARMGWALRLAKEKYTTTRTSPPHARSHTRRGGVSGAGPETRRQLRSGEDKDVGKEAWSQPWHCHEQSQQA